MEVNFLIENYGRLKYLGCSTAANYLMKGLKKQGVNVSVNSMKKEFDIVHAHTMGPVIFMLLPTGKVRVTSGHSTPSLNTGNILGGKMLWDSFYRIFYNLFDYVLPVSGVAMKELRKLGVTSKMHVVPNCVDHKRFRFNPAKRKAFRKKYKIGKELAVLNVAQLTPRKGIFEFIELARKMPEVRFFWFGGLPYSVMTPEFKSVKDAMDNAPKNLQFVGFVDDITCAYCGCDVFLTPTKAESFGMTVLEAESCRTPVIATDLPVFREVFGNSAIYAKNVPGFMKCIERMKNAKTRKYYSRKGFEKSLLYDTVKVTKDLKKFYESIL